MSYIQQTFGDQERWVNWQYEERDGDITKVPKNPKTGGNAMSNNPTTWTTYAFAKSKSEKVGIQLGTTAGNIVGIDIDHTMTDEKYLQLLQKANTYTEISPSGNGLRAFLLTKTPYSILKNKECKGGQFEVYNKVRFLTVTEKPFAQYNIPIRTVTHEELTSILEIAGYPWGKEEQEQTTYTPGITTLDDEEVLKKMFSASNGAKVKALYESFQEKGGSEDDGSFCTHLAFWCGKDPIQMERIWLSSPIGQRKKTQTRKDYRDRTIKKAISITKDVYKKKDVILKKMTPQSSPTIEKEFSMDMLLSTTTKSGDTVYILNTENICRILNHHPEFKGTLQYDSFKNTLEILKDGKWVDTKDYESINIQTKISVLFPCFAKVSKLMVEDALNKVIHDNEINSVADYIKSLTWDNVPRLDTWLSSAYGVDADEYHKSIGSNWMKGVVKRAIVPGSKFDYVLVLEGPQGGKKTSSLEELGNINNYNAHVETTMSTGNKDFYMSFKGKLIVEFSEGETLSRSETKQLKSIITTRFDNYREPYGRKAKDHPRMCVFAMTTNEDAYLKDDTGNRRWLPVKMVSEVADIEWIKNNREQLYAESYHRVITLNESTWEFPQDLLEQAQDERRIEDTNADVVLEWYCGLSDAEREEGVTSRDVFNGAIKPLDTFKPFDKLEEMRITGILKASLKLQKKRKKEFNKKVTRWYDAKKRYSGYDEIETVEKLTNKINESLTNI